MTGETCTIMVATRMRNTMSSQNGICCYDDRWEDTYYSQRGCIGKIVFSFEYSWCIVMYLLFPCCNKTNIYPSQGQIMTRVYPRMIWAMCFAQQLGKSLLVIVWWSDGFGFLCPCRQSISIQVMKKHMFNSLEHILFSLLVQDKSMTIVEKCNQKKINMYFI